MVQCAPAIRADRPIISCSEWMRSPAVKVQRVLNWLNPAASVPRLWTTPLGWPVVPDVKMMTASWPGLGSTTAGTSAGLPPPG
jgi:hypothetical protein